MKELFRQFSFPGGIPSHAAPETPGSIHEGGELGYALAHAYGAAFDNPDLLVACVIGDGEFETSALAGSWQSNKFTHPVHDGTVLPILHLNGYKIANSTVPARIPESELLDQLRGHGHRPYVLEGGFDGEDPHAVHVRMAEVMDEITPRSAASAPSPPRSSPPARRSSARPGRCWCCAPPKGWTGPRSVDGKQVEGSFRAHQVPLTETRTNDAHRAQLEEWLRSYRPEELFDETGRLREEIAAFAPAAPGG
jgi:xylulose-5-phosphate/fructose-6-phosphate phosphoketolase